MAFLGSVFNTVYNIMADVVTKLATKGNRYRVFVTVNVVVHGEDG